MIELENFFGLNKNRLAVLDGLRGIAIFMVFNVHALVIFMADGYYVAGSPINTLLNILQSGHVGVNLFFILSGFLIYRSIKEKNPFFLKFMSHRYLRLLPLIIIVTLPFYATNQFTLTKLFDNLTFLGIFGSSLWVSVTWTIVYEVYFYVLAGILLLTLKDKFTKKWPGFILVAVIVWSSQFWIPFSTNYNQIDRFMGFFFGMAIAKLVESGLYNLIPLKEHLWLAGVLGILALQIYSGVLGGYEERQLDLFIHNAFFLLANCFFSLVLISSLTSTSIITKFLSSRPLRSLGVISYPFFLIHLTWGQPITKILISNSLSGFWLVLVHYLIMFSVSVILSIFLWYYFERRSK